MSKPNPGLIDVNDVDRIFDAEKIKALASFLPVSECDQAQLGKAIRGDVRIFAQSARAPNTNDLYNQIAKLEEAGRANDAHVVGVLLDDLYPANKTELASRWARLRPGVPFPSSEDLSTDLADEFCVVVASICRDGGAFIDGHLRKNQKRSIEWNTTLHAPRPNRNVEKVAAEQELVRNLSLTWLRITDQQAPDIVHKRHGAAFAKFVSSVLKLVGSKASASRRINEHGERRRLPLFAKAAIWKWRAPSKRWSELPDDLGIPRLIESRFNKWPEREVCEHLFLEMAAAGRSDFAIEQAIFEMTEQGAMRRNSILKKKQRKQLRDHKKN